MQVSKVIARSKALFLKNRGSGLLSGPHEKIKKRNVDFGFFCTVMGTAKIYCANWNESKDS